VATRKRRNRTWKFVLYVAGDTAKASSAIASLKKICNSYVGNDYEIQVIDFLKNPELARQHQILAVPTVVRTLPPPEKRVVGDLSRMELVVNGLELPEKLENHQYENSPPAN
jgi:circadian clock protein KaiB